MRVRICKEILVDVDTEVSVGIEDIQATIAEAMAEAKDNPRSFSVSQFVSACWVSLNSLTNEQIELVGPCNCEHVANALHTLAERFERHVAPVAPVVSDDPADQAPPPVASEPSLIKWRAVWQQKPHESHSRMIHEFLAPDDRDKAMSIVHLNIQRDYGCVTFTIHKLENLHGTKKQGSGRGEDCR